MPNRIDPNNPKIVQHKVGGRWRKKQKCISAIAAQRALRLLRGVAHGMVPNK